MTAILQLWGVMRTRLLWKISSNLRPLKLERRSKLCPPRTAMGHLQTCPAQNGMSASLLKADITTTTRNVGYGPRVCENAKTLNRDRTSYSFETVLAAHIASPFNFEIELENIILVTLRVFEFSHSLGQNRKP